MCLLLDGQRDHEEEEEEEEKEGEKEREREEEGKHRIRGCREEHDSKG